MKSAKLISSLLLPAALSAALPDAVASDQQVGLRVMKV